MKATFHQSVVNNTSLPYIDLEATLRGKTSPFLLLRAVSIMLTLLSIAAFWLRVTSLTGYRSP